MKKTLFLILVLCSISARGQNEKLTNQSILEMIELGFGENIIVTKINTSETYFDTSIEALKELKTQGVSSNIIVAMMETNKENNDKKTQNAKTGIYYIENGELKKIFPTVFSGTKTSTLGAAFTYGIANAKIKSIMSNAHSSNIINTNIPDFYFFFDNENENSFPVSASNWWFTTASSPNEFVLARLKSKKGKRELNIGKANLYAGNTIGIEEESIVPFNIEVINEFEFKVTPRIPLEAGEYCFFYQGIVPQGGFNNQSVFDFSVSENSKAETKYKNGDYVWIIKKGKPRSYEIESTEIKKDGIYYYLNQRNSWDKLECKESQCYSTKEEAIDNAAKDE